MRRIRPKAQNKAIAVEQPPIESGEVEVVKKKSYEIKLLKDWWNGDKMHKAGDVLTVNEFTFERLTKTQHAKEI